ncbi:MAG: FG-GAP repeat domain-containing protein, partial [Verrucomicrobiales bacterium]
MSNRHHRNLGSFLPILAVVLALLVAACSERDHPANSEPASDPANGTAAQVAGPTRPEGVPYAPRPEAGESLFIELGAAETGIDFTNPILEDHPLRYLYSSSMSTGGAAIADFDGDGKQDIFLANGPEANRLFRQTSRMKFEDVGPGAGIGGGDSWAIGCAFADVDNDGDSDVYVCNYISPNQLFLNNGDGTFVDVAPEWGVDFSDASHTPSFCDYDGDGDLDLYILTNRWYRPEGFPQEQTIEQGPGGRPQVMAKFERFYDARQTGDDHWESVVVGRPDILCRNDGNGKFVVANESAGISHRGHGLSASWFDWNDDGWIDLWVGNDFDDQDHLYMNRGNGTFLDVTHHAVGHISWYSMGADFGDLNGDGLVDFLIADMAGSNHFKQKTAMGSMSAKKWFLDNADPSQLMRNSLYLNAGNGRFLEGAYLAGLASTDWTWAVRVCDFDQDGRDDVFFQCGMSRNFNERDDEELKKKDRNLTQWERFRHLPPLKEKNRAFRNLGDLKFENISSDWGIDHLGMSYGCAVGDLDGDGALDMVSVRLNEPVAIYHNTAAGSGNSIEFSFEGKQSNRQGIGTKARLFVGADDQTPLIRTLITSRGYLGSD